MQGWGEGYVVDVDYTRGYFRELSPVLLRFVGLLGGTETPADEDFTYVELGCGNGYTTTLHAAMHPRARFVGVDFNPTHIHTARRLAQEAGVGNVRFVEKSFGELREEDVAEADFAALHGVWSWIGDEQRAQILDFLRRRLKPGGVAYVSYNSMPGLAPLLPLQRLLFEHAAQGGGERLDKVRRSVDFAERLARAGARYFAANPLAANRLANIARHDPHYVAHEYHNANWATFYHADVARALGNAKLAYLGSATLADNFPQFSLSPELGKLLSELGDHTLAETLKDYARNQAFRRDIYTRGAPKAIPPQLDATLGRMRFALSRPRKACQLTMTTAMGKATLQPEGYAPVLDALARAPMTGEELAKAPECAGLDRNQLRQAVFGMAAFGNLLPALPADGEEARAAAAARLNAAVLAAPITDGSGVHLASPVIGAGIGMNLLDRLFFDKWQDRDAALAQASAEVAAGRLSLKKDERKLETKAEQEAHLAERVERFYAEILPFLRQLRVAA